MEKLTILFCLVVSGCISNVQYNEQELVYRQGIVINSVENLKVEQAVNVDKIENLRRQIDREIYFLHLTSIEVEEFLVEYRRLMAFFDSLEQRNALWMDYGGLDDPLEGLGEEGLTF